MRMTDLLLDADGVLLDFARPAMRRCGLDTRMLYPRGEYSIAAIAGLTESEFWQRVDYPEFWRTVNPYEGCVPFLRELWDLCGKHSVSIRACTRSSWNAAAFVPARVAMLDSLRRAAMMDPIPIYIAYCGGKGIFGGPGRLLVDDDPRNVADFEAGGGRGLVVPMPWNRADGYEVSLAGPDYHWLLENISKKFLQ